LGSVYVDLSFICKEIKTLYSHTGRHPEVLLRMLLMSYLYGITSNLSYLDNCLMDNKNRIIVGVRTNIPEKGNGKRKSIAVMQYLFWVFLFSKIV
jgi:hypothetical protein